MRITTEEVRQVTKILDELIELYKEGTVPKKRDWRTYEQRLAQRIRAAIRELEPLVDEAIASLKIVNEETRGRKPELTLKQKTILLLLKHLFDKSNREMSAMLVVFSLLSDLDVSYKTIERLYSDEEVKLVLHNLRVLMLRKKGVKDAECSGDGTGGALTITKHYATEAQKLKDKAKKSRKAFFYSFKLLDLKSRMYIAYGTSLKSEDDAFRKAMEMAKETDINIESMRLDRYYSKQAYVRLAEHCFGDVTLYLIPKKNATVKGPWGWKRMLHHFVNDPHGFLEEYFQRNQSESGFGEDKRRFGWGVRQRREDRIDVADSCTLVWHNLFWLES